MSNEKTDSELTALETALSSLTPTEPALDRCQLMFRAGMQAAERRRTTQRWLWPLAAAAMALVSACLGVALAFRAEPQIVQQIVYVPRGTEAGPPAKDGEAETVVLPLPRRESERSFLPSSPDSYLQLRQVVLTHGVAALPDKTSRQSTRPHDGPSDMRGRRLLDELLES